MVLVKHGPDPCRRHSTAGPCRALLLCAIPLFACGARSSLEREDAATAPSEPEACNGRDDDGDGEIDEGLGEIACGLGACRRAVPACRAGAPARCEPGPASEEICNDVDDDCDGATDEGLDFGPIRGPYTVAFGGSFGANVLTPTPLGFLVGTVHATVPMGPSTGSIFALPIGLEGQSLGDEQLVLEDAFWGPGCAASADGGATITSCWTDSRATSRNVDSLGVPVSAPTVRAPGDRSCGAGYPATHWTGARQLFAWIDNSTGPIEGHEVLLDVADAAGASLGARQMHPDGDLVNGSPAFAQAGDRVALSFGVREPAAPTVARLWLGLLGAAGEDAGPPRILSGDGEAVAFGPPVLVPRAAGGFVLLAGDRFSTGLYSTAFGADLSGSDVVARVTSFDDRWVTELSAAARPGGGSVLAATAFNGAGNVGRGFVASLDDGGGVTHSWESDDPDEAYLYGPSVGVREGRVFVAYRVFVAQDEEIRLREFGCRR